MTLVARMSRTGFGLALLVCAPLALAHGQQYRIGAPASWIQPVPASLDSATQAERGSEGYELLLTDRQDRVGPGGAVEGYYHVAYRLHTQEAVENRSQLEFSFDPIYQQLTVHQIAVIRDGRRIDQLRADRMRVVSRETERDYNIFDGSLSLVTVLEGVKPGDVVEYSFSRNGANPVFAGHYLREFTVGSEVPIRDVRFRLLWPSGRPLHIRPYQTSLTPRMSTFAGQQEYLWSDHAVPATVVEASLPSWFDPLPSIQLSDFASWGEVAAWGASLFGSPGSLPAELRQHIDRIRAADTAQASRVLAALRLAQDEVRYLGVEIGVNSHRPYPIETVLRRGYGDCKDKAQLLVAILRELGLPAHPVLVSTTYGDHIGDRYPTANVFDHAIVQVEVNRSRYWLDPTMLYQRGTLEDVAVSYGAGLVLGSDGDTLVTMPRRPRRTSFTDVVAEFRLGAVADPATMVVHTTVRGSAAEYLRSLIKSTSAEKLQKDYTEFYTDAYPGIRSEAVPTFQDVEEANEIRSEERYTIPGFWHQSQDGEGYLGTFDPLELGNVIPSLSASGRTMPLGLRHPVRYHYQIRATLHQGWNLSPANDTVQTEAVRFVRSLSAADSTLTLSYDYETLADHVGAATAPAHLEKLSRIRRLLALSVTPPAASGEASVWLRAGEFNWPIMMAALLIAAAAVVAALRVSRMPAPAWPHHPPETAPNPTLEPLQGLHGWLVLVGLGVVLSPIMMVVTILRNSAGYAASTWAMRTSPTGTGYHPLWAPALLFELTANVTLVVFTCLVAWHFFRKSRWFPALFVVVSAARVVIPLLDSWIASHIPAVKAAGAQELGQSARNVVVLLIWIWYMFRSRRVRNTFVHGGAGLAGHDKAQPGGLG